MSATIPRYLSPTLRVRDPLPPWPHIFLMAWTGMRGIVTLAAAMALPVSTGTGAPFPFRSEIILLSFTVILATLVLRLREETLAAERSALIRLRDEGTISDEVLHRLEQEVDVEALRLGIGERRMHA